MFINHPLNKHLLLIRDWHFSIEGITSENRICCAFLLAFLEAKELERATNVNIAEAFIATTVQQLRESLFYLFQNEQIKDCLVELKRIRLISTKLINKESKLLGIVLQIETINKMIASRYNDTPKSSIIDDVAKFLAFVPSVFEITNQSQNKRENDSKKTYLTTPFKITKEMLQWCNSNNINIDIEKETQYWVNYNLAKENKSEDWLANWKRRMVYVRDHPRKVESYKTKTDFEPDPGEPII